MVCYLFLSFVFYLDNEYVIEEVYYIFKVYENNIVVILVVICLLVFINEMKYFEFKEFSYLLLEIYSIIIDGNFK